MLDIAHILFHCIVIGAKTENAFYTLQHKMRIFPLLLTTPHIGHFAGITFIQPFPEPLTSWAQFRMSHPESIKTQAFRKSFKLGQLLLFF